MQRSGGEASDRPGAGDAEGGGVELRRSRSGRHGEPEEASAPCGNHNDDAAAVDKGFVGFAVIPVDLLSEPGRQLGQNPLPLLGAQRRALHDEPAGDG
ncbi:MAG: hypothetical protein WKF82_10630 [Nocardioidaceae bacterium]